ncbi:MAG: M48 family metalloprotease [Rhodobacteraceae bacterium]|nr:M48 family metalloprotease [Paracoccaceae bacterium]
MARLFVFLIALFCASTASAVSLLRDAGMERALDELARPILNAAGLSPSRVRVLVVDEDSLNAFVIDGNTIYLHSGLILRLGRAEQLQAVIAHEAAHIANGHISRRMANMRNASRAAALGIALAAAAGAAGADGQAVAGIAAGTAGSAQRVFLGHTRAEEAAADQSSIRYLLRAGIDTRGALEVVDLFRGQEALSASRQDPYNRSHPLTTDRYRTLQSLVDANPGGDGGDEADYWFARAKGVLSGFKRAPGWTLRRATGSSDVARMRRAIAHHRNADSKRAISEVQTLVGARPNDPYFRDLQGQILLENRQFDSAVQAYSRAVQLAPNNALILGSYGRALLAKNTASSNRQALDVLIKARSRDGRDARILRDLGLAYSRAGNNGMAALSGAERAALRGRIQDAGTLARRAAGLLPRGSAGWQRAQDIIRTAELVVQ